MPKPHSAAYHRTINATSADESPLLLLEIDHPDFSQPIRVVNDTQDLVSNANTYVGIFFHCKLPDDREGQMPRAELMIDNVGKDLVEPLEASNGGEGATVRIMEVLRSDPDTIEWEATLDLKSVRFVQMEVTGALGYEDILNRPAVLLAYRPDVAPGLF
jgi:hypothetical protein